MTQIQKIEFPLILAVFNASHTMGYASKKIDEFDPVFIEIGSLIKVWVAFSCNFSTYWAIPQN